LFTPADSVTDWFPEKFKTPFEYGWFINEYKVELDQDGESIFIPTLE